MPKTKEPRKGFDSVEPQFLCPYCGKIIKSDENFKPGSGEFYECPNCHETINTDLLAPPSLITLPPPEEK
jgi:tRNA(Ile2) C34 agmatinyltransferase TiaS